MCRSEWQAPAPRPSPGPHPARVRETGPHEVRPAAVRGLGAGEHTLVDEHVVDVSPRLHPHHRERVTTAEDPRDALVVHIDEPQGLDVLRKYLAVGKLTLTPSPRLVGAA